MAKVTGIGGVFFRSRGDHAALAAWYQKHRVDDLGELLANLRASGVEVLKGPESDDNGTFAWIMDPDGNKVELWEPKGSDETSKAG